MHQKINKIETGNTRGEYFEEINYFLSNELVPIYHNHVTILKEEQFNEKIIFISDDISSTQ